MEPTPDTPDTPKKIEVTDSVPEVEPATEPSPAVEQVPVVEPTVPQVATTPVNPGHGLGIASLILSILGVHLIGLILGIIGLNKSKKAGQKNGLALAGIIIGAIGLVFGVIIAILLISVTLQIAGTCADLGPGYHSLNGTVINCR